MIVRKEKSDTVISNRNYCSSAEKTAVREGE